MRVTKDSLLRIAKETVQERAYNDPDIVAAYLSGSLRVEPMLGGSADIDLVFVHKTPPQKTREFVKLTPDFHLDIRRRAQDEFKNPRELRGDPWLGWEMYDPVLLYEREKFFDFIQASLRAGFEFEQPPLTLQRCHALLSKARNIWFEIAEHEGEVGAREIRKYMDSLFHAINAVAELSGAPIWERRLLLDFPVRAESAQRPNLLAAVYALLGANQTNLDQVKGWLNDWKHAFKLAAETPGVEMRIHPTRQNYYEKGIKALLESDTPLSALWPLLYTWTLSAAVLSGDHLEFWRSACAALGLIDGFAEKTSALDHFLDEIEILLEEIAAANGLDADLSTSF
ncbi:MAG: hypothetical protein LC099_10995 [Anaerolineales bacterium]|nr:hypothetical protein [Anaerolineales bacterium]